MAAQRMSDEKAKEAARIYEEEGGNMVAAARRMNIPRGTLEGRVREYRRRFGEPNIKQEQAPEISKATTTRLREAELELARERRLNAVLTKVSRASLKPPRWTAPPKAADKDRAIATAFLSDCHFDEVVKPEEIGWVNAYDREIAEKRLRKFFESVSKLMTHYVSGIRMDGLVLPLGGDLVSGNIHEELEITNQDSILSTCLHWSEQLAAGVNLLKSMGVPVHIPCVVGNHGRLNKKPRYKGRVKDNFDWLIYRLLTLHFQGDEQITFDISESTEARWNCYATRYHMSHGDQFGGGSGISGILTPLSLGDHRKRKVMQATNRPYDVLLLGHFHQLKDMGGVIVNGALKGYDEFAAGHNFGYEPAQQAFWLTDPKHGKTIFAPVHVECTDEPWRSQKAGGGDWMARVAA